MRKLLLLLLLSLLFVPAFAQFTSNVQGTVTDPNGSVMVGAKVTLTNTDTNVSQVFVSNAAGQYYFNRLAPGPYTVEVVTPGFEKTLQPVRISTEQTAGVDIRLKVGATSDTVSVTAEDSHGLNPDETRVQYTLSADEIANFPLQNKATLNLLKTAPGATGVSEGHENVSVNRDVAGESVNGRSGQSNLMLVDGIPVNSELANVVGSGSSTGYITLVPHPDMIEEAALQATTFSVENGATSGVQVSLTTKSGSNKFHGDLDYAYSGPFLKADSNNSKSNVLNADGSEKVDASGVPVRGDIPGFRRQVVSGALGGPIWKDKTFFFGSYFNQGNSNSAGGNTNIWDPRFVKWAAANYPKSQDIHKGLVPHPADRAIGNPTNLNDYKVQTTGQTVGGFNFVNFSNVACDATTDESSVGTPDANGLVAVPCSLPILTNVRYNATSFNDGAQYNFRVDHGLHEGKDRIYASFFRYDEKGNSPRVQSTYDGLTPSTAYLLSGSYVHTFSPSLVNFASFGQSRFHFDYKTYPYSASMLESPYYTGVFSITGLQDQSFGSSVEHQSYGRDSVSWVVGKHNLVLGFQGALNTEYIDQSAFYGRPFYDASFFLYDYLADVSDYELIYTLSAQKGPLGGKFVPQYFGSGTTKFGAYAQDSWKVTPNLVLNYGIRWDDFGNPAPYGKNAQQLSRVTPGKGSTFADRVAGTSVGLASDVYESRRDSNFLPRGGFAYTLPYHSNLKTVVHGGAGLYEDDLNLYDVSNTLPTQPPVRLTLTLNHFSTPQALVSFGNSTVQGPAGGQPYGFQFPTFNIYGYNSYGAPVDASGKVELGDVHGVDPNLKPEKTVIYNFGLEQELAHHAVFGLLYTGSHSTDQLVTTDVNTYAGAYSGGNPVAGTNGGTDLYSQNFQKIKSFRNAGSSNYNGMIATMRETLGKLTYQASYTWGKSLGDPTSHWTDQRDIHSQYTYQDSDIRNRFTLTQTYEVPAFFKSGLLNQLVSGWTVSDTVISESGSPFTVATGSQDNSRDFNNDGNDYDLPVFTGTKRSFSRSDIRKAYFGGTPIFDPTKDFSAPVGNTEGDKQNNFRGAGYFSLDTGLGKKFSLPWFFGERASFDLRGEASNILNRANYGGPSDTTYGDGTLGKVYSVPYQPRIIQIGGRFQF